MQHGDHAWHERAKAREAGQGPKAGRRQGRGRGMASDLARSLTRWTGLTLWEGAAGDGIDNPLSLGSNPYRLSGFAPPPRVSRVRKGSYKKLENSCSNGAQWRSLLCSFSSTVSSAMFRHARILDLPSGNRASMKTRSLRSCSSNSSNFEGSVFMR